MMPASACAVAGTSAAGLNTTVLPKASAGAIFHAGMAMGKFHGVMIPTTPTGSRAISTSTPGRTESMLAPVMRTASPAKNLKMCPARSTSATPSARTFPSSRDRSVPSASLRARIALPMKSRISARR